jgi:hypothetical protein
MPLKVNGRRSLMIAFAALSLLATAVRLFASSPDVARLLRGFGPTVR